MQFGYKVRQMKVDWKTFYSLSTYSSEDAAKFYKEHRYKVDEGCVNPCKTMDVVTNLKYRRKRGSNHTNGYLKLYFPRQIVVTTEIMTKTFITAGTYIHTLNTRNCNIKK